MGSPITFSGFNQIDFNMILEAVMAQERQPLTALQTQKSTLETQSSSFATFLGRLSTFQSAVGDLGDSDALTSLTATSSDPGVGVTAGTGRAAGSYDVVVSALARAQVTASTSTTSSPDTTIATGGTLSLLVSGYPPVDIQVTGSMSLRQLADAINSRSEAPVSASVVQASPGNYRLVLTGRNTGVANAFTLTSSLTGGPGVTFADPNGNGVYGETADGNTQAARDASLTVNSLPITSSSNVLEEVVPGVTLSLTREDPAKTVQIQVARDNTVATRRLQKLVSGYNDIVNFIKAQGTAAANGQASIGRDPLLKSFKNEVRTALLGTYPDGGDYSNLARIGVEFDRSGNLQINQAMLDEALKKNPGNVEKLLSGANGDGGVVAALKSVVTAYTGTNGLIPAVRTRLGDQASRIATRLDTMEVQLSIRRAALQREYAAADSLMTQLKSQGNALGSLGNQYSLF